MSVFVFTLYNGFSKRRLVEAVAEFRFSNFCWR